MVTLAIFSSLVHDNDRLPSGGGQVRVRSWTGRAAVSCSTDSIVPRFTTIANGKTRVSEMRLLSRPSGSFNAKGSLVPVRATVERRHAGRHYAKADTP
jgi:hypothetical protein